MVLIIQVILGIMALTYLGFFVQDVWKHREEVKNPGWVQNIINVIQGFITNFLDTLGIGSFAPQTIIFRVFHLVPDESYIPGTLNVANTLPVMFEGLIFLIIVKVESLTLAIMVIVAVLGGVLGARIISRLPVKKVQLVVAFALLATAILTALRQAGYLDMLGVGNTAIGLRGLPLILAAVGVFVCGVLQSIGVGFYAPCMAIVYLAGLNPLVAFPIMMVSCAAVMPIASIEFIRTSKYSKLMSIIIMISGIIGVYFAANFVKDLSLDALVWIIVGVVIIGSISMFHTALKKEKVTA